MGQSLNDRDLVAQTSGVVLALPNVYHEAAVSRALEAGLTVLCEKPLAQTVVDLVAGQRACIEWLESLGLELSAVGS